MTTTFDPPRAGPEDRARRVPARRAMVRWGWRLLRREWRQQLLILGLVVVAVAAVVVGATVSTDTPAPSTATFGTAQYLASFPGSSPHVRADVDSLERRFGPVDVIENQTLQVPGSVQTYQLRAQDPHGPFGGPLLSLVDGHYPTGPGQVALTKSLEGTFGVGIGGTWHAAGRSWRVVGTVVNPDSLLDEFALVSPGQVQTPTQVTVLFDAHGVTPRHLGPDVRARGMAPSNGGLNPTTIVLGLATVGMLLIALVGVGGFTVLAQRRLRAIGMVESLGATDRDVRLSVIANGVAVGAVGAVLGLVLGIVLWLAYRPIAENDAHHVMGAFALPWDVIVPSMALALLATLFAASRPARAIARIPVVTALSGRPAPPRQVHRSAVPAVVLLVGAFFLFGLAASLGNNNGAVIAVVPAFVVLIVGVILLSPFALSVVGRLARRGPVAVRLALRDLARYRARSGSALAAISIGVLAAVVVAIIAAGRYGNVLDYAGPNLTSSQLLFHTPTVTSGPGVVPRAVIKGASTGATKGTASGSTKATASGSTKATSAASTATATAQGALPTTAQLDKMARDAARFAAYVGGKVVTLETTSATLLHAASGRNFSGPVFVATPALLRAFGIPASSVSPTADVLTMRPGLASISTMQLVYGNHFGSTPPGSRRNSYPCPKSQCLANPVIEQVSGLPSGTSAPNTVITEHAVHELHLQVRVTSWMVLSQTTLTPSQINDARLVAASSGMSVETRNSAPSSSEIINWATVFGVVLALCILAMSVGLIRSETASELRTLTATGASSSSRRVITATTASALGFLGAVLGTVGGYVAAIGFSRSNQDTGISALGHAPVVNLLIVLVGMPLVAGAAAWLLAGRQPTAIARRPTE